jgi:FixJ family two-component response regulator
MADGASVNEIEAAGLPAEPMNGGRRLILVVEDDVSMRQAVRRLLHAAGYRTHVYQSAEALLAAGDMQAADCLLLDVRLPGVSGTELYARLGDSRPPAVFITSNDGPELRGVVSCLGGAAVLPKPFLGDELIAAISRATQR